MRSKTSTPFGKAEHDIKVWLPELPEAELRVRAASVNKTISEYVRDLILVHLHGHESLISEHRAYLESLEVGRGGKGAVKSPTRRPPYRG